MERHLILFRKLRMNLSMGDLIKQEISVLSGTHEAATSPFMKN
jgi:hypothetical protein